eukprot:TRINITY_DN633_c0_g1_i3.p1 TRINITY_DN633_c0_g1~~TRINITY_DN633_c0_g1_i3.p1  ORF type:complete len:410 (-),score=69.37 TRINITY_DN633_c0_g1_i3:89-1183(-)
MRPHTLIFAVVVLLAVSVPCTLAIRHLTVNATWALTAWGFPSGGKDSVDGEKVIDVDLFDTAASTIATYKQQGHIVLCYFSAGSWESYRPDANNTAWAKLKIGKMNGWNELWLDIRDLTDLKTVMGPRMDLAASKGCDGVEPDNIDCFANSDCYRTMTNPTVSKGSLVKQAQLTYNSWLASYAHNKSLLIAQKNCIDLIPQLYTSYDLALNEQCQYYSECDSYKQYYITAGKPVFNVEYAPANCTASNKIGLRTKYCSAVSSDGDTCASSATWINCFPKQASLNGDGSGDGTATRSASVADDVYEYLSASSSHGNKQTGLSAAGIAAITIGVNLAVVMVIAVLVMVGLLVSRRLRNPPATEATV